MKKILLTGSNGFLGTHILSKIINSNQFDSITNITGIDNFISSNKSNVYTTSSKYNFIEADLIKFDFDQLQEFDTVIHLASLASPFYYNKYPLETVDIGTTVTRKLLEKCKEWNARFIFFSSSEIYGNPSPDNIPTKEEYKGYVSCQGSRSCYDESKRLGETLCYIYNKKYNINTNIIRPFNIYGPGMSIYTDYRMIPNLMKSALRMQTFNIYGNGNQTRTFCYYTDAIEGIIKVIKNGVYGETYNIGNDKPEISMIDLVKLFRKTINIDLSYKITPYPEYYPDDEPLRRLASIEKAREHLNFHPKVTLEAGLTKTWKWALKN
ncbi:NAD-dependent epimerase/dehydratase family protein [Prochlorococcus marinus]|uniref:NAD-dependent epimerase/dehydratase family protein n=1 Tax=Prochlorococcus marinus TaxID=1219 RepID=UPI0022B5357B|nr:NAD-dependent epimerase/dehydratase family protein [Prochlorococcus marinus]